MPFIHKILLRYTKFIICPEWGLPVGSFAQEVPMKCSVQSVILIGKCYEFLSKLVTYGLLFGTYFPFTYPRTFR